MQPCYANALIKISPLRSIIARKCQITQCPRAEFMEIARRRGCALAAFEQKAREIFAQFSVLP